MGTQTTLVWLSREGERMTSQPLTLHEQTLLQRSAACPRRSTFKTAAGSLILHSFCPPSLVTSLKADRGLHAFTHVPEREHQLLLGIAERPDCALTLAYTSTGEIVGQMILIAVGLSWHWDLKGSGLSPFGYRSLLAHILEPYHFFAWLTDEPNVGLDPANILLVRIGKRVEQEVMDPLFQRMRFF